MIIKTAVCPVFRLINNRRGKKKVPRNINCSNGGARISHLADFEMDYTCESCGWVWVMERSFGSESWSAKSSSLPVLLRCSHRKHNNWYLISEGLALDDSTYCPICNSSLCIARALGYIEEKSPFENLNIRRSQCGVCEVDINVPKVCCDEHHSSCECMHRNQRNLGVCPHCEKDVIPHSVTLHKTSNKWICRSCWPAPDVI